MALCNTCSMVNCCGFIICKVFNSARLQSIFILDFLSDAVSGVHSRSVK